MGHEGANQDVFLSLWQALSRVIYRLVKSISSECSLRLQTAQIDEGRMGIDLCGKHGGVRSYNKVFDESSLKAETRYAKRSILVIHIKIASIVSGFRDTPWHTPLFSIFDLPSDYGAVRFIQECIAVITHNQKRHQIFKDRPGPRYERTTAVN